MFHNKRFRYFDSKFFSYTKTILFILCFCLISIAYAADTVDMQILDEKITVGETFTLSYQLNAIANTSPDFSIFQKDFYIVATNRQSSINIINGTTQMRTIWQLTLEPKTAGELWIPEIDFGKVKSKPRKVQVAEATAIANTRNDSQNNAFFVRAELNNNTAYVQSQVLYTFKLFYRTQLANPIIDPPMPAHAKMLPIGNDKHYETTIKGERFLVYEKTFAIFPQKPGKLVIPPMRFRALQYDLGLGAMNDPFSITGSNAPITLATQTLTLDVKNIPNAFQGKIWLPAKDLSLNEKWSVSPSSRGSTAGSSILDHWESGNPVTRTITIETTGLKAEQIPDIVVENIPGVNVYADQPQRNDRLENNNIIGVWQQKIAYIPTSAQPFTIPAMVLPWWNTQTNTQEIARLNAIPVHVSEKVNTPVAPSPSATAEETHQTDVAQQKVAMMQQVMSRSAFYLSPWFWISISLLVLWIVTIMFWLRSNKKPSENKVDKKEMNQLTFSYQHQKKQQPAETTVSNKRDPLPPLNP